MIRVRQIAASLVLVGVLLIGLAKLLAAPVTPWDRAPTIETDYYIEAAAATPPATV